MDGSERRGETGYVQEVQKRHLEKKKLRKQKHLNLLYATETAAGNMSET